MPLQVNVEEVPSQDEEEMYECLLDQTAQPAATRSTSNLESSLKLRLPGEAKRHRFAGGCCAGCITWSCLRVDEMVLAVLVDPVKTMDDVAATAADATYQAAIQATWVSEGWGWISCSKVKDM